MSETAPAASTPARAVLLPRLSREDRAIAIALGLATVAVHLATQGPVGFTRDEGYYFTAAAAYEQWIVLLLHAPAAAIANTERYWSVNYEHPGLAKLLFACSHLVFTRGLHVLGDTVAWRLPAFCFGGLLSYWLVRLGCARSRAAGVLAPLLFWTAERTFFHGHLACFDIPICALTVGLAVQWLDALGPGGRLHGMAAGLALGAALAVKHNTWFYPPVLAVFTLFAGLFAGRGLWRSSLRPWAWTLVAPLVLFAAWPLLWHDPGRHLGDWIRFHTNHVHYTWEYFGDELRRPPFPVLYPLVLLAVTLPVTTVILLGAGGARLVADFFRSLRAASRRLPAPLSPQRLLELGFAGAAVFPFMLRTTPIFGGIKHWLAAIAFLAPEAAGVLVETARGAAGAFGWLSGRRALALASAAALLPGLWQIAHVHPYGTSAYGELAGDVPGAASLGMQRQYWSNNVTGVLPWLNQHCPTGARVFFHEVNVESYRAYQQMGMLRRDLQYAGGPGDADYAALQWHREFRDREPETWNAFGTRRPATGLYLDETPQVVVYARPGVPGAP